MPFDVVYAFEDGLGDDHRRKCGKMLLACSIRRLCSGTPGARVHLLCRGLDPAFLHSLAAIAVRSGGRLYPESVDDRVLDSALGGRSTGQLGRLCGLKLVLHRLYPSLKRVLWLDADAVPTCDLSWLLSDGNPLFGSRFAYAMVPDRSAAAVGRAMYGNCGVVPFDLEAMRADPGLCSSLLTLYRGDMVRDGYREQDALSAMGFHELGREWNLCLGESFSGHVLPAEVEEEAGAAKVVHFSWHAKEDVPGLPGRVESIVSGALGEIAGMGVDLGELDYTRSIEAGMFSGIANARFLDRGGFATLDDVKPDPKTLPPVSVLVNDCTHDYFVGGSLRGMMSTARRSSVPVSFVFVGHGLPHTSENERSFIEFSRRVEDETGAKSSVAEATGMSRSFLEAACMCGGAEDGSRYRYSSLMLADVFFPPVAGHVVSLESDQAAAGDFVYELARTASLHPGGVPFYVVLPLVYTVRFAPYFLGSGPVLFNRVPEYDGRLFDMMCRFAVSCQDRLTNDSGLGLLAASGMMDALLARPLHMSIGQAMRAEMANPSWQACWWYHNLNSVGRQMHSLLRLGEFRPFSCVRDILSRGLVLHYADRPKPWDEPADPLFRAFMEATS